MPSLLYRTPTAEVLVLSVVEATVGLDQGLKVIQESVNEEDPSPTSHSRIRPYVISTSSSPWGQIRNRWHRPADK